METDPDPRVYALRTAAAAIRAPGGWHGPGGEWFTMDFMGIFEKLADDIEAGKLDPAPAMSIGSQTWPGLSKLVEEAGEVLQVVGKLMGTGCDEEHWDGTDLRDRMVEELADLRAAAAFVATENLSTGDKLRHGNRMAKKARLFHSWHEEQGR